MCFVPALDEKRPATLSRASSSDMLRDELRLRGRDPERRPRDEGDRQRATRCPAAAVLAVEAGCDGVLICSGDHDTQAAALEALIHAVEERATAARRGSRTRCKRQQRAKERFLAGRRRAPVRCRARRCGSASAATSIAPSPTRWRGSCDAEAARARAGRPPRRRRSRQPVRPRRVRPRGRGDSPPRLRAGLRRLGVRAARVRGRSAGSCAPRRFARRWRDPAIAGIIAVRGGYGSAQVLPLLDRARGPRAPASRSSATATSRRCSRS